jgi:hypothetical protein
MDSLAAGFFFRQETLSCFSTAFDVARAGLMVVAKMPPPSDLEQRNMVRRKPDACCLNPKLRQLAHRKIHFRSGYL